MKEPTLRSPAVANLIPEPLKICYSIKGPKLVEMSVDDGSGQLLSCIIWESIAEAWRQLPDDTTEIIGRVVAIDGQLRTFRNVLQIRVTALHGIHSFCPEEEVQWWLEVIEEWDLVEARIFEQCICPRPAEVIQLGPVSCKTYSMCPCRCHLHPDFPCYISDAAKRLPPAFAGAVAGYKTAIRALVDLRRKQKKIPTPGEIKDIRRVFEVAYSKFGVMFTHGASIRLPAECVANCIADMAIGELIKGGELSRDEDGTLRAHDRRLEALESVRRWAAAGKGQGVPFGEVVSEIGGKEWEELDSEWFLGLLHAVCEGEVGLAPDGTVFRSPQAILY
ncbi:hypothetical protein FOL47_010738 [Perkinsus chesapeaki]|uniref:Uncharacterized protein n=1 Tax=Perkinsus chesapeaki TaxID=330153 RepID=A0A7J6MPQ6_PERCH|nr:hypothetical protein FOL47_010738 [Perkinsus chesapeaki]